MPVSLLEHAYIAATSTSIVVALLMALVIYRLSRGNSKHVFLELIFVAFAISVFSNTVLNAQSANWQIPAPGLTEPFQLVFGPLFYLYLKNLSGAHNSWKKSIVHFVPFLVLTLLVFAYLLGFARHPSFRIYILYTISALSFFVYGQLWIYYFLCRTEHRRYRQRLKQSCSEIEQLSASWVGEGLAALLLCYSVLGLVYAMNHGVVNLSVNMSSAVIVASLIYFMAFQTLKRPQLFSPLGSTAIEGGVKKTITVAEKETGHTKAKDKYQKSGVSGKEADEYMQRVRALMQSEQPYLDPELSIGILAGKLEFNVHHLSQVINSSDGRNFFDFVNGYRIEQVKVEFADPANAVKTVLEVAMNSGFNSKATFNRIFRKYTGTTPSAYRKSLF